jgi:hypothetical protein
MIDDHDKTMELMQKMEAQLPIPAHLTSTVARMLLRKGIKISRDQKVEIKRLFYHGDEGGIVCDVTPSQGAKEALVISVTHLRVDPRHSLAKEIRAYQKERTRRLAQPGNSGKPSSFTARPHGRQRH